MRGDYSSTLCEEHDEIYKGQRAERAGESPIIVTEHELRTQNVAAKVLLARLLADEFRDRYSRRTTSRADENSMGRVIEDLKDAPVAYFKFASAVALLGFLFSIAFYLASDTILVNPVFAVYGAIGSAFSWILAAGSERLVRER